MENLEEAKYVNWLLDQSLENLANWAATQKEAAAPARLHKADGRAQ